MNSIRVMRTIGVKALVTENLKQDLDREMKAVIKALEEELQQIEFQARRVQIAGQLSPQQQQMLKQGLEMERQKRLDRRNQLRKQIEELQKLPVGSEIDQGTVQGPIEVEVGADWDALFAQEIVIKDGKVVSIRQGQGQAWSPPAEQEDGPSLIVP